MAATFDIFGVSLDLDVRGNDQVEKALGKIIQRGRDTSASFDQITRALKSFINELGAVQRAGGIRWDQQSGWTQKSENWLKKALGLDKQPEKNPLGKINTPHYVIEKLFRNTNIGRAYTAFQGLNLVFAQTKAVWKYADAIAKVNQKLLLLSYSSGIGISSLKAMGAAAEAFGGSAQTIASAEERLQKQLAAAKRGQGFGYLQDVFWKYGFQVDLGWNAEQMREAAIRHGRTMSKEDQLAFAGEVDPANKNQLLTLMRASPEMFAKWQASQARMKQMQSEAKTIDGKDRAQAVADTTLEFQMSMSELSVAWNSIRDQIALTLLPIMTKLAKGLSGFLSAVNKFPELISGITLLISAIAAAFSIFKMFKLFGWFKENVILPKWLHFGGPKSYGFKDFMKENPALRGPSIGTGISRTLKMAMQWIGRFLARFVLRGFGLVSNLLRLAVSTPLGAAITAIVVTAGIVKATCNKVEREAENLNKKDERLGQSVLRSRDKALQTQAKRLVGGELWEGDVDYFRNSLVGKRIFKEIKNIDDFSRELRIWQEKSAEKLGIAKERIQNFNSDAVKMQYERIMRETGQGVSNINNSRVQLNQTNNIYGAQDPGTIKEAVVESGQTLAAKGVNLISSGGQ